MERRLPLHTLPAFRAAARLQNLRLAADELHLTHSAVSQQIKQLEEQSGVRVFDRVGRRLRLNDAGRALQAAVEAALTQLEEGLNAAAAVATEAEGGGPPLKLTLLPSFAQRWLLPRMARWRAAHPDIRLELQATSRTVDLVREGFHAALRQGEGKWRGLIAEPLIESPLVAVGTPEAAARLRGLPLRALSDEPLLGDAEIWQRWFRLDGCRCAVRPVANFNDAGHMLQAAEQGIGIALARELFAADALAEGRLVRLSPLALPSDEVQGYWFVYPPELKSWPPLLALRRWLQRELRASARSLPLAEPVLKSARGEAAQPDPAPAEAARRAPRVQKRPGKAAARR